MENVLGLLFFGFPVLFFLFIIILGLGSVAFSVWMLIDCLQREESEFEDKTLWTVLLAVGLLAGYSLIISVVYFFIVKKKLDN